jgi:hypothetical protein
MTASANAYFSGGGSGSDATAASGGIFEVELIAISAGKNIKPVRLFTAQGTCAENVGFFHKVSGDYYPLTIAHSGNVIGMTEPQPYLFASEWGVGRAGSLVAKLASTITGGAVACFAIVEQA